MTTEPQLGGIGLFDGGPPLKLEQWLHLRRRGERRILREPAIGAAVAWLPLAVLAAAHGDFVRAGAAGSFLLDAAVHARYLVALPVLILAESVCTPRLGALALHFVDSRLIPDSDRSGFDAAVASTIRLRDSALAEVIVIALAYAAVVSLVYTVPTYLTPSWYLTRGERAGGLTLAAWWNILVSLPLLLVLIFGWIWRVALWARFLRKVSKLELRLLPSHPDRAAGLRFAGHSLRAFALPAFGLSVIVAGAIANRVLNEGASLFTYWYLVLGVVLLALLLFVSPLLVFSGRLLAHWQRGVLEYGTLANRVGQELERRWLDGRKPFDENPLEASAFSATADLYQVVANVYGMRLVPIDAPSVVLLIGATVVPFLPVLLLSVPLDAVLRKIAGFLI